MSLSGALIVALLWAASLAGAGWWAYGAGADSEIATQAREDKVARISREAAIDGAAQAIAKIKVQHTTVKQEIQREIQTRTVYADCRHTDQQLRNINAALTGAGPEPAGGGLVPRADAAVRPELRRDDAEADRGGRAVP